MLFGTWVQNRLDATDENGKKKFKTFEAALGIQKIKPLNVGQLMSMGKVRVK